MCLVVPGAAHVGDQQSTARTRHPDCLVNCFVPAGMPPPHTKK
jgi:hypothetical protein